jgi:hypothetical protein
MKGFIVLIVLCGLFIITSLMVYITDGKNSYLLRKKLRVGALIISITAAIGIISGCKDVPGPFVKCYAQEEIEEPQPMDSSGNITDQTGPE